VSRWYVTVHVWGYIGVGVKKLVFLPEGTVTKESYCTTLEKHLLRYKHCDGKFWQQDRASAHQAKMTLDLLEKHKVKVMPWVPKGADLSPIENMWAIVKARADVKNVKDKDLLKERIQAAWDAIPQALVDKLVRPGNDRTSLSREKMIDLKGEQITV
jgi:transposase